MKIGIATISDGTNYGNRLQNYATQQVAKRFADEVVTIDVGDRVSVPFVESIKIKYRTIQKHGKWHIRLRKLNFDRFNKKNINFSPETYKTTNFNSYDYILCGSDQIWNFRFRIIRNNEDYYFARFVPPEKRVAFSASVGTNVISKGYESTFAEGVSNMKAVSVREDAAVDLIKETANQNCICTVDPTLMLDEVEWLKIAKKPKGIKKDSYILTYFMGLKDDDVQNYVSELSKSFKCKVVNLHSEFEKDITESEKNYFTYSPAEFVWLVKNCKVMLTDSFHGCVFSILMDKPFQCFARKEKSGIDMSSRMNTLFAKLQIGDWCKGDIDKPAKDVLFKDYSAVAENLDRERNIATNYLKNALMPNLANKKMVNVKKEACTGCEACKSICPKQCISMQRDKEGFYYPYIDETVCINCGLCEKVCIAEKEYGQKLSGEKEVYSAISADDFVREHSSSGGIFTALARKTFESNGVVCGAAYSRDWTVHHKFATDEKELKKLQRSKYVGSHIDDSFIKTKEYLENGKNVLFTGTLCQVNGLKSFLGKDYDNLFLVDVVCHGVPSESVWLWYLNQVSNGNKIKFINQRLKRPTWSNYSTLIKYDGANYKRKMREDVYMRLFLKDYVLRQSCYQCKSKGLNRSSDLTIADFWGVKKVSPEMFDNKGTSVIIINSDKGKKMMQSIEECITFRKENINDVVKYNPSILKPVAYQQVRENVLGDICGDKRLSLDYVAEKYDLFDKGKKALAKKN